MVKLHEPGSPNYIDAKKDLDDAIAEQERENHNFARIANILLTNKTRSQLPQFKNNKNIKYSHFNNCYHSLAIQSKEVDDHAVEEERRIENEILEILRRRESIWKQRSRELWLAKGDRNTSFFHAATVVRKRRNQILVLLDDNGRPKENEAAKRDILNGFFKKLYTAGGVNVPCDLEGLITPSISAQENEMLLEIPSEEEIKLQVFQMHPLKAPGPDGFSGCFFRRCWEIVKTDVITFVQEFFRTGELSGNVNHTFLCLIPKGENPKTVDRFRPIALWRWIAEASILTQEIVHTIKKKKGRVLLNGKSQKKTYPGRGLRQGDPISPYLFVLCNDVLSRMLDRSQDRGDIHGIKISRKPGGDSFNVCG
uniref:Reverse transcriptase domain-containing protein n=1 Tax=Cannabis sativa TaxID=3483 RepID=A0A803PFM8_CANSA